MNKPNMETLQGIELRSPFTLVQARLGKPDTADYSPADNGDRFGSYKWQARGIAVLTWITDHAELVWGVRLEVADDPDPKLEFNVGSHRDDVLARFPGLWREQEDLLEADFEDSRLVVILRDNRVRSIQLLGPMGGKE